VILHGTGGYDSEDGAPSRIITESVVHLVRADCSQTVIIWMRNSNLNVSTSDPLFGFHLEIPSSNLNVVFNSFEIPVLLLTAHSLRRGLYTSTSTQIWARLIYEMLWRTRQYTNNCSKLQAELIAEEPPRKPKGNQPQSEVKSDKACPAAYRWVRGTPRYCLPLGCV